MITIIVSMITSGLTTAFLYWYLHRANPTATQVVIDSAVDQIKTDVSGTVELVKDKVEEIKN